MASVLQETVLQMPTRPEALTVHMENLSLEMTLSDCDHFATQIISFLKHVVDFRALAVCSHHGFLMILFNLIGVTFWSVKYDIIFGSV